MATVGSLVFEMSANIARLQQDMAKAQSTVSGAMKGIESAVGVAKTALGTLGVATTAAGFVSMIEGAIESEAALLRLARATGQTVELLSSFKGVAKQSGTDLDLVGTGLQKLAKNMLEAQAGTGKAGQVFESLGINVKTADGNLRDAGGVMQELAGKLASMENQTQAAAFAQLALGKAGANLLPFLLQLAEAGTLQAKVTTEQAEAAHKFEANLAKIQGSSNAAKIALANGLLPALVAVTDEFVKGQKEGGLYQGVLRGIATLLTGNDRYKNDKQLTEQTEKLLALQQNLQDSVRLYGKESGRVKMIEMEIARTQAAINTTMAYRKELEKAAADEEDKKPKRDQAFKLPAKKEGAARAAVDRQLSFDDLLLNSQNKLRAIYEERERAADRAADAEARRAESEAARLDAQAERWRQLLDPLRQYEQEIAQIAELVNAGKLDPDEGEAAYARVNEKIMKVVEGAKKSAEATDDIGRQLGLTFSSAFEKALAPGAKLRDLLHGIEADIARIIARKSITEPIAEGASAIGKGVGDWFKDIFGGARASGGSVDGGKAYLVGENGPELMVPSGAGSVVPNDALGGSMNVTINVGSLDPRTAASVILGNMPLIVAGINQAYNSRGQYGPAGR